MAVTPRCDLSAMMRFVNPLSKFSNTAGIANLRHLSKRRQQRLDKLVKRALEVLREFLHQPTRVLCDRCTQT
jgi:hypothetical protein